MRHVHAKWILMKKWTKHHQIRAGANPRIGKKLDYSALGFSPRKEVFEARQLWWANKAAACPRRFCFTYPAVGTNKHCLTLEIHLFCHTRIYKRSPWVFWETVPAPNNWHISVYNLEPRGLTYWLWLCCWCTLKQFSTRAFSNNKMCNDLDA